MNVVHVLNTRKYYIMYYIIYVYVILATYRQNYIDRLVPPFDWYCTELCFQNLVFKAIPTIDSTPSQRYLGRILDFKSICWLSRAVPCKVVWWEQR